MYDIAVIGGGAAGLVAAGFASQNARVLLLEKNAKLGKKLFITGKGRCNITNLCAHSDFIAKITSNPSFLYSALSAFSPYDTVELFNSLGLKTKVERGNRVFPESDKSSDVIGALIKFINNGGVDVSLNTAVNGLKIENGTITGVIANNKEIPAKAVIIATGGLSYPLTGSTGDGYGFAEKAGHTILPTAPSLVPLSASDKFMPELQGLSLKNIELLLIKNNEITHKFFGEMLFTGDGVSGPVVLSASRFADPHTRLAIDLKPALTPDELDARLLRDFSKFINKNLANALDELLPQKLIAPVITASGIKPEKKAHSITKQERAALVNALKGFPITVTGTKGYNEAVITTGGVSVKEINPKTMESRLVKGLFFAGEIIDTDGPTGGFNLQIAFSTGCAAGKHAASSIDGSKI